MSMPNADDINKPGGWLVRVTTPGDAPRILDYYAYELDRDRAVALVKDKANVRRGETAEAIEQVNIHALTGMGMRPGEVKEWWGPHSPST
jgi:hypothetical protein